MRPSVLGPPQSTRPLCISTLSPEHGHSVLGPDPSLTTGFFCSLFTHSDRNLDCCRNSGTIQVTQGTARTTSLRELTLKLLPVFDLCALWLVVSIQSESCKQLTEEFESGGCKVLDSAVTGVGPQVPVTCGRRGSAHLHASHHR